MKTMTTLLAGTVVAATMMAAAPASAQSIGIGPDGPSIDFRNRAQRERDRDYRREMRARDGGYYREQRFRDRERGDRRGYDY